MPAYLGEINGHVVGRVLKEAVRRAMVTIRGERLAFEATTKASYGGTMDDVFTSADTKAQAVYLRTFEECFPLCGVIAEEESLTISAKGDCFAYFTVDPLDGTKAFVRRQSHGVGTMVALVVGDDVIAAYIGDINTNEMYGYRPGSDRVHRISELDSFELLDPSPAPLSLRHPRLDGYVLLRDPADAYSPATRSLISYFKGQEVMGGSIGIWAARLWKREVNALLLRPSFETPWDSTPVVGISRKLGYVFLRPDGDSWVRYDPGLPVSVVKREHDMLIVHANDLVTLNELVSIS